MTQKARIYVASPLGFSEIGRHFMYAKLIPAIEELGYTIIDPWKLTSEESIRTVSSLPYGTEKKTHWAELNKLIGKNNADGIRKCSGLLAVLDGADVDSGTAAEIGFAAALGKPIIGYRGDFRTSGDNEGSVVNLQVEFFVKMHGGKIIRSLDEMKSALKTVMKF